MEAKQSVLLGVVFNSLSQNIGDLTHESVGTTVKRLWAPSFEVDRSRPPVMAEYTQAWADRNDLPMGSALVVVRGHVSASDLIGLRQRVQDNRARIPSRRNPIHEVIDEAATVAAPLPVDAVVIKRWAPHID